MINYSIVSIFVIYCQALIYSPLVRDNDAIICSPCVDRFDEIYISRGNLTHNLLLVAGSVNH